MLNPNNKQKTKILDTANKCIECQNIVFDYLLSFIGKKEKFPSVFEVRRWFTLVKSGKDNETMAARKQLTQSEARIKHLDVLFYDVSNDALKQIVKDTYNAFVKWFKKLSKMPVKKHFNGFKKSFYVDPYKIHFTDKHIRLEKISNSMKKNRQILNMVRLCEKNRIPTNVKYYNPRVVIEGDRIFIVVTVDTNKEKSNIKTLSEEIIGIDVNIHSIDLSNEKSYKSPLKSKKIKKIIKKGKRFQRRCSYKLLVAPKNTKGRTIKSKSFLKLNKKVQKLRRRLVNVMTAFHQNIIKEIFETPPKEIHIEDLNINGIKKNKKLSHSVHLVSWGKFFKLLNDKCEEFGIKLLKINRFFASSKTCHECGYINENLTLRDRTFICPKCGYTKSRDINAALNIRDYKFN